LALVNAYLGLALLVGMWCFWGRTAYRALNASAMAPIPGTTIRAVREGTRLKSVAGWSSEEQFEALSAAFAVLSAAQYDRLRDDACVLDVRPARDT
jgi:hypothetical protein